MKKHIKRATRYYFFTFLLLSLCINAHLRSDIGSISPTINDHIYTAQWDSAGLENGELSDDYPVITGTINVYNSGEIQSRINEASNYTGIWRVMLQPGTYVLEDEDIITMKSNVILSGPYLTKENKDEDDRAVIEFNLSSSELNCIVFNEISNAGIEDVYIKRIDTNGNPTGTQTGNNIYLFNCNNCCCFGGNYRRLRPADEEKRDYDSAGNSRKNSAKFGAKPFCNDRCKRYPYPADNKT